MCPSSVYMPQPRLRSAHDFIERLPEKYDTIIGEKGFRLSGGERQRLAIARALLKNAPILILDEATSSLDLESESLVQAALANLMQGRTSFVIAHRLSTIRRATRIVVLEDGKISDIGSHEQLLVSSQTYQRLYRLQFHEGDTFPANPEMVLTRSGRRKSLSSSVNNSKTTTDAPIYSMTGFGRTTGRVIESGTELAGWTLSIKSVNHRFLDLHLRLPGNTDTLEMELRRQLKQSILRGHIELTLTVERATRNNAASYDRELVTQFVAAFRAAQKEHGLSQELRSEHHPPLARRVFSERRQCLRRP